MTNPWKWRERCYPTETGDLIDEPFNKTDEVISGYYHIIAKDLEEAVETAEYDPGFKDGEWRMEIRPIMEIEGIN